MKEPKCCGSIYFDDFHSEKMPEPNQAIGLIFWDCIKWKEFRIYGIWDKDGVERPEGWHSLTITISLDAWVVARLPYPDDMPVYSVSSKDMKISF